MPEEFMKLISTERDASAGPTSWNLSFSIQGRNNGEHVSPEFNINKIVDIRFLVHKIAYNDVTYKIAVKKGVSTKMLQIKLQLYCQRPYWNNISLMCIEKWSEWHSLGSTNEILCHFQIKLKITVSKVESMTTQIYEDKEFTDFQLSTDEGSVPVHKVYLATNSEVFKTMLTREWKETTEGRIKIDGVTLQTLQYLKDYMYLGRMPEEGLIPLLQLATCYMIDNLKAECYMKLAETVTSENLYDLLAYSFCNNMPELTFLLLQAMPKSIVANAEKRIQEQKKSSDEKNDEE